MAGVAVIILGMSEIMNVVCITQDIYEFSTEEQEEFKTLFPHDHFYFFNEIEGIPDYILERAEVLISMRRTAQIIRRMPRLRWLHIVNAGLNGVPLDILKQNEIILTNVKGIHGIPIAEYTIGMMLSLVKNSYHFYDKKKLGIWERDVFVDEINGKTLGIVGLGAIGTEIAKKAQAFGMKVLGLRRGLSKSSPYVNEMIPYKHKERIFRESDFIVLILPLTEETTHFVGQAEFDLMKETAYLINIARGPIVDEQALLRALHTKRIKGAVLDVFDQEPLPSDHPFWKLDNVMITPHLSGHSPNTVRRANQLLIANLKAYPDQQKMLNVIDLDKGY